MARYTYTVHGNGVSCMLHKTLRAAYAEAKRASVYTRQGLDVKAQIARDSHRMPNGRKKTFGAVVIRDIGPCEPQQPIVVRRRLRSEGDF